jgi:SecD/SecF fusion protein
MLIDPEKVAKFMDKYGKDDKVTRQDAERHKLNLAFFEKLDRNRDGVLDHKELEALPSTGYQLSTTEIDVPLIQEVAEKAFGKAMAIRSQCTFKPAGGQEVPDLALVADNEGLARVEPNPEARSRDLLEEYAGGVAVVVRDVQPAITEAELKDRIAELRSQSLGKTDMRRTEVLPLGKPTEEGYSSFAVLVKLEDVPATRWRAVAQKEMELVNESLAHKQAINATKFSPAIAGLASQRALVAVILSWIGIVLYLWLRFGTARWGLAAVVCMIHDTIVVVGLVAVTGWLYNTFLGRMLGLSAFKMDLTMIAAVLTVIGYSTTDTIVVFDRIRENRGKLTVVTAGIINESINQTLSRTILTSCTTLLTVLVMYVFGGEGLRAFNFALVVGIVFGTYSSIAIASPLLMGFKTAIAYKAAAPPAPVTAV